MINMRKGTTLFPGLCRSILIFFLSFDDFITFSHLRFYFFASSVSWVNVNILSLIQ